MDAQELRNLQEAYMKVYHELDEAPFQVYDMRDKVNVGKEMKNKKRAKNKADRLDQDYGGYRYKVIPTGDDRAEVKYGNKKEEVDLYDIILSHLLDEGYAETPEAAESIMVNMSEEWRECIIESFIEEDYSIQETSLNRIRSKSQKGGMAILSGQRGDKSSKENKERSKRTERRIRGAGLPGPTKVSGRYTENPGTPQEKKVGEKSHVVSSGKMGKRKFKKTVEKLGTEGGLKHKKNVKSGSSKDDQDSVLIQRKPGGSATLKGTSKTSWPGKGKNVNVGKMKPGRTGEFDTKVKNKTFTYEED